MDINRLVGQLRAGDDSAGPILVSIVAPRLLGYAAAVAADISDVDRELLVESAIERAVERIDRFDPARGSLDAWIRGILRYAIADWRREHAGGVTQLPEQLPVNPADIAANHGGRRLSAALTSLVLGLSEADQLLLTLRFVEQLPHAVIAERVGATEAASRKRLQRVLARLRRQAAEDPDFRLFFEGDTS